ncbi:hypothetical protein KIK06_10250 [Nocardiopsis sp. EMB25]|uniref:hypothetical protein n=1 Tax=Nocardiopsis sp. EMB25 TaxID=2835867 RepID=UPI0022849747|nr:hypothetical protein [Nocardiopsis sp. EMB25]MCY9784274.1 hypothetical protein [Nocardiopsis sp. EMB25]
MTHRKVYLAVGRNNTRIYRFDPIDGDTRLAENVPPYEPGYTAMGAQYRGDGKEPLLFAVSGGDLITIDVEAGTLDSHRVKDLPSDVTWYDGDMSADGKTLFIAGSPNGPSHSIDVTTKTATPGPRPGGGRWDDFARHPKDHRLISVEGDNGDLLHVDPGRDPMKTVLKQAVFKPAEASASAGSRRSYSAMFFDTVGNFYAVDSAGNVNHLDMTTDHIPDQAERIGNGKIPVDGLEVMNGAGLITQMPVKPSYDEITVTKKFNTSWENYDPRGRVYSFELTLTAADRNGDTGKNADVRTFRISFDLPTLQGAKVQASGVDVIYEGGKAYLSSQADQLLTAGSSRPITVQITVPGDTATLPREYPLDGLRATRLA